jgi:hypothetical protein
MVHHVAFASVILERVREAIPVPHDDCGRHETMAQRRLALATFDSGYRCDLIQSSFAAYSSR